MQWNDGGNRERKREPLTRSTSHLKRKEEEDGMMERDANGGESKAVVSPRGAAGRVEVVVGVGRSLPAFFFPAPITALQESRDG